MHYTGFLSLWVFTMTAHAASGATESQTPPLDSNQLLSRVERLERLLADHQAQSQSDYVDWEKAWKKGQELIQTLAEENGELRTNVRDLQRRLEVLEHSQRASEKGVIKPNSAGEVGGGDGGERSPHVAGNQKHGGAALNNEQEKRSVHREDSGSSFSQGRETVNQHVVAARSDDQGPLEVTVNQLAQQTADLRAEVQTLKSSDAQQNQDIQAARGSTYVHWGRSSCSGSSELVYSGTVGGSSTWDQPGAAASTLCLSPSPKVNTGSHSTAYTLLYGAEYETLDSHQDRDPLCSVCLTRHPTTIMVPGTDVCAAGWTLQYWGFLMAGHHLHKGATEFICVDPQMESVTRSEANQGGHLLYYTRTSCGSLLCPPYVNDREVYCAVCSK